MRTELVAILSASTLGVACGGGGIVDHPSGGDDTGTGAVPNIVLDATSVDFGEVALGDIGMETLTIRNTGAATLTVLSFTFSSSEFTATAGAGLLVQPGASTPVGLRYTPTDYAADDATLSIETTDPDEPVVEVALHGAVVTDQDGDGYDSEAAGGDDCDDSDPTVHPDAEDEWYDGIDSNCDGANDYDQDGDGWEDGYNNPDPANGGGDCQDTNPDIHPGADDVWYDGVDSNCDGADDYDQDGDGEGTYGHGDDCDDTNPDIRPSATEAFNLYDDNCDGEVDLDVEAGEAPLVVTGTSSNDLAGSEMVLADVDRDGVADLVLGASGYSGNRGLVSILLGGALPEGTVEMTDGDHDFWGDASNDALGTGMAWLDAFGASAAPALAVGAPGASGNYGRIYVIPAASLLTGDIDDAELVVAGDGEYLVGRGIAEGADVDGDGLDDLFAYYASSTTDQAARVFVVSGDTTGSITVADADGRWAADGDGTVMRDAMPMAGDLDGDGYDDLVFCDHLSDVSDTDGGAVWLAFGGSAGITSSAEKPLDAAAAWHRVAAGAENDRVGYLCTPGPDRDGDGDAELWIYHRGERAMLVVEGGSHLRTGTLDLPDDAVQAWTFNRSDPRPETLRAIGDLDGDGISEMAVGLEPTGSREGGVWVWSSGAGDGTFEGENDAMATLVGNADEPYYQDSFGLTVATGEGDLDGNGVPDLVAADPAWLGSSGGDTDVGAVYVYLLGE